MNLIGLLWTGLGQAGTRPQNMPLMDNQGPVKAAGTRKSRAGGKGGEEWRRPGL
jgi:hypothetical protein